VASKRPAKAALTGKQRAFIAAYCHNGLNGVRAAKTAGYQGSYSALGVIAHENLKNPKIRQELDKYFKQFAMGPDEVIARMTSIARGDMADVLNPDGSFDIKSARRRGKSHLIKEQVIVEKIIPGEDDVDIAIRTTRLKLHDAHDALKTIAKMHGILSDRLKIDDWRSEAIEGLRSGDITPEVAINVFGDDLAAELFALAGVKRDV
jgi:phage terminase small subunit